MYIDVTDETFEAEVLKAEGVVVVDFWAGWCAPCKAFAPIFEDAAQEELGGKVKFCKVNVDEAEETSRQNGVMAIPTVILYKDGQPVDRQSRLMPKQELLSIIKRNLD